ncbi:MAG: hypothetical protein EBU92_14305, partial [Betaproteobacteria bacterium]|nr:hypothetical protein [Betaproteobacteria bacterium]
SRRVDMGCYVTRCLFCVNQFVAPPKINQRIGLARVMQVLFKVLLLMDRTFEKFNFDEKWQLLYERSRQICGHSARWICLLGDARLEMVDLLTGELLWSLSSAGLSRQVFAADQVVLLRDPRSGREVQLEPLTGVPRRRTAATQQMAADQKFALP